MGAEEVVAVGVADFRWLAGIDDLASFGDAELCTFDVVREVRLEERERLRNLARPLCLGGSESECCGECVEHREAALVNRDAGQSCSESRRLRAGDS